MLMIAAVSLGAASCSMFDPEYAAYKKEQEAQSAAPAPYGGPADPYGAPGANPYGVPGGSEVGTYTPGTPPAYDPLPGTPGTPTRVNPNPGYPTIPSPGPAAVGGSARSHTVSKGDSLWGLSQQYGTSVDVIKQANGLSNDTIQVGQTLQIPGN